MTAKAISVKQPWAYLICAGIKDVENRTWKLPKKYIGKRVYIHASAKCVGKYFYDGVFTANQLNYLIQSKKIDLIEKVELSAIIGHVEFSDCVINHPSIWAEKSEIGQDEQTNEWIKPIYNWVVANAILFDKPIFNVKGKISFWDGF